MNIKNTVGLCLVAAVVMEAAIAIPSVHAQGTAFTYQGQLMNNGQPANGNYDITFTLFGYSQYGFPVGSPVTNLDTSVSAGLFTATLDFGSVFGGSNYWLEIAVRTNGNGAFTTLLPRQPITPVPYAIFSSNALTANMAVTATFVPAEGITGTIPTANLGSNVALLTTNGTLPTNVLPANLALGSGIAWQSPSGTSVQAQPNTSYVLTNSQQVTITLPAAPNVGDRVEVTGAGLGGWVLAQNAGQTIAASFTPLNIPGDASGNWYSIAASSDGTKVVAASATSYSSGGIVISSDSGASWRATSAPVGEWASVASSSNGLKLAAVAEGVEISNSGYPGGIWTSSDGGTNWTEVSGPPSGYEGGPPHIVSSSDGTKLALAYAIGVEGSGAVGEILASSGSGSNWVKTSAPTNAYWTAITSSSDGTKLAATSQGNFGGGIWISSNTGASWAQATDLPVADWQSIGSSLDGTKLVAAASAVYIGTNQFPGGIWISSDEGATWVQTSAPGLYWAAIASSSDGTKLAAVAAGGGSGGIWTSSNSGTNWAQISAPAIDWVSTLSSSAWNCIVSSSDGTTLAAGINGGGIWTVMDGVVTHQSASVSGSTMLGAAGFLEGNFGTVLELVYTGGGQFVALYQTGTLSGH
ncbi:MAG TPA: sialidase family protein [Verrucomicrobiae bacterium]|jgi:hypothetical protein|nr:sialidase family protein [Verrucomicrobiae bacterium]